MKTLIDKHLLMRMVSKSRFVPPGLNKEQMMEYVEALGKFQVARKLTVAQAIMEFPDTIQFKALMSKLGISESKVSVSAVSTTVYVAYLTGSQFDPGDSEHEDTAGNLAEFGVGIVACGELDRKITMGGMGNNVYALIGPSKNRVAAAVEDFFTTNGIDQVKVDILPMKLPALPKNVISL